MGIADITDEWSAVSTLAGFRSSARVTALVTDAQISAAREAVAANYLLPYLAGYPLGDVPEEVKPELYAAADGLAYCVLLRQQLTVTRRAVAKASHEASTQPTAGDVTREIRIYRHSAVMRLRQALSALGISFEPLRYNAILDDSI